MNRIDPIYKSVLVGYVCECGNKTDWWIQGMAKTRIIQCASCQASIITTYKVISNG